MPVENFEVVGRFSQVAIIARGRGIRDLRRLVRSYGGRNWWKKKGVARIRLENGQIRVAELHWYEAHGIGKKEIKWKEFVD
jgi:hypothetical protein